MSNDQIRVGIAGLGRSGWSIHAELLSQLPDRYAVTAVVDADEQRRVEAVDRFDCQAYTEYDQLLADPGVELVVVALPSHIHADGSIAALRAGKHVVCEKPMATSLPDADRMVDAADQSDRVLTIFQQRRYNPDFVTVRRVVESGVLGRIVQINIRASKFSRRWDWQTLKQFGGGSLNNTGPHFVDQALQLFGDAEPQMLFCHLDRTLALGDADDHVKLVFKGENAPTVDIEISSCDAYPSDTWHILGTQGGLRGTANELHWKWVDPATMPPRELDTQPTPDRSYNRDNLTFEADSWRLAEHEGPTHIDYYVDLYNTIRNGAPLAVTPQSVRRVIWMQEACHRLSPI
jgi:predicted dehydrogenase